MACNISGHIITNVSGRISVPDSAHCSRHHYSVFSYDAASVLFRNFAEEIPARN